jgi:ribosomal protein S18 acetylase RimI-like enzyme
MVLHLDAYRESSPPEWFRISTVTGKRRLAAWLRIVNKALFGCKLVTLNPFNDVLRMDNTRFYLGFSGRKPVTACMTITQGDTSVLEMVATLPKYRRRGFASALINKALLDLREKGIKTVSLRAEADGVSVYQRLGFRECCKRTVASYDWKGD